MTDPRSQAVAELQEVRRRHQPAGNGRCQECGETYPCAEELRADDALDRIEARQMSATTTGAE